MADTGKNDSFRAYTHRKTSKDKPSKSSSKPAPYSHRQALNESKDMQNQRVSWRLKNLSPHAYVEDQIEGIDQPSYLRVSTLSNQRKGTIQHEKAIDLGQANNYLLVKNVDLDTFAYSVHESTFRKEKVPKPDPRIAAEKPEAVKSDAGIEAQEEAKEDEAATPV